MNLVRRVVSGLVLVAILVGCLALGDIATAILIGVAAVLGMWEFARLARGVGTGAEPLIWLAYPLTLWWALRAVIPSGYDATDLGLGVALVVGLLGVVVLHVATTRLFATIAGAGYVGFLIGYLLLLYRWQGPLDHEGIRLVAVAMLAPISGDTAAYFGGSALGKHRFFPEISPKKSLEGAVSALIATVVVEAIAVCNLLNRPLWQGAILGALLSVAAQAGDLGESKLKREAGVKDSSALIPGHGGLLDRLDSVLVVAPVVYICARAVGLA